MYRMIGDSKKEGCKKTTLQYQNELALSLLGNKHSHCIGCVYDYQQRAFVDYRGRAVRDEFGQPFVPESLPIPEGLQVDDAKKSDLDKREIRFLNQVALGLLENLDFYQDAASYDHKKRVFVDFRGIPVRDMFGNPF